MKMRKKYIILVLIIFFITPFILFSNILKAGSLPKYQQKMWGIAFNIFMDSPDIIKSTFMIITGKRNFSNLFNDYNVKFLPETQYIRLNFVKKEIEIDIKNKRSGRKSFFLNIFNNDIILVTKDGKFLKSELIYLSDSNKSLKPKILNTSGLIGKDKHKINIYDTLVIDDKIYISATFPKETCSKLEIFYAKIENDLSFKTFKKFDECLTIGMSGGKMQKYVFNSQPGILITTGDSDNDRPGTNSQKDDSIYGKILFIDLNNKSYEIFSKGHRNAQGLAVKDDLIISTEHGPRGGDEINIIKYKKNYGWPIASYGYPYERKDLNYKKSHEKYFFEEPIYVFLPSLGISELIFLPDQFDPKWQNSILVTTLNDRSIHRVKFQNEKFDKILYVEKIYIGERIRDIKYLDDQKIILLSLERTGSIGVLSK